MGGCKPQLDNKSRHYHYRLEVTFEKVKKKCIVHHLYKQKTIMCKLK